MTLEERATEEAEALARALPPPDENSPTADWWCWTEGNPSTFRCRELHHDVRPRQAPWPPSTLERARQAERERDQLREDLAKAEQERDRFIAAADKLHGEWLDLKAELAAESRRVAQLQVLLAEAARARDLAIAEVATASKEVRTLRAARQWIVARDGGRDCVRCEQEIRRGEAYELLPGADQLRHIHCRTEGEPTHG